MSDPERWLSSKEAPAGMGELLSAAQKVGPTAVERAALGAQIGVGTSGLWIIPAAKLCVIGAVVAGSAYAAMTASTHEEILSNTLPAANPALRSDAPSVDTQATHSSHISSAKATAPLGAMAHGSEPQEGAPQVKAPQPNTPDVSKASPKRTTPRPLNAIGQSQKRKAGTPISEANLIRQARAALNQSPKRALSLLDQHQSLYPAGLLAEERKVLRIRALKLAGQERAAAKQQRILQSEHPDSVHHLPN